MEAFDLKTDNKFVKLLQRIVIITGIVTIAVVISELLYGLINNNNSSTSK